MASKDFQDGYAQGWNDAIAAFCRANPQMDFSKTIIPTPIPANGIPADIVSAIDRQSYCGQLKALVKTIIHFPNFVPIKPTALLGDLKKWNTVKLGFVIKRSCYCYLLLDTQILINGGEPCTFWVFVRAIFYIGKGHLERMLEHFAETYKIINEDPKQRETVKHRKIQQLWDEQNGVTLLPIFHLISSNESHVHEACMIHAMEPQMLNTPRQLPTQLTNIDNGFFKEVPWTYDQKMEVGVYNLWCAWKLYEYRRSVPVQFSQWPKDVENAKDLYEMDLNAK